MSKSRQPRFRRTRVDPAVEAVAAAFGAVVAFLDVPPVTPFLMVLMTVRFVAGADASLPVIVFLMTVDVLPSLESLILRAVRVAGRGTGGLVAAVRRVLVFAVVPVALEAVEDVVVFLVGAGRAELDRPVRGALGGGFTGDAGRAM